MERYDPERLERSTRDVVARACYIEILDGRGHAGGRRAARHLAPRRGGGRAPLRRDGRAHPAGRRRPRHAGPSRSPPRRTSTWAASSSTRTASRAVARPARRGRGRRRRPRREPARRQRRRGVDRLRRPRRGGGGRDRASGAGSTCPTRSRSRASVERAHAPLRRDEATSPVRADRRAQGDDVGALRRRAHARRAACRRASGSRTSAERVAARRGAGPARGQPRLAAGARPREPADGRAADRGVRARRARSRAARTSAPTSPSATTTRWLRAVVVARGADGEPELTTTAGRAHAAARRAAACWSRRERAPGSSSSPRSRAAPRRVSSLFSAFTVRVALVRPPDDRARPLARAARPRERRDVQRWAFFAHRVDRRRRLRLPPPARPRRRALRGLAGSLRRGPRALRDGAAAGVRVPPAVRDPLPHAQRPAARAARRRRAPASPPPAGCCPSRSRSPRSRAQRRRVVILKPVVA